MAMAAMRAIMRAALEAQHERPRPAEVGTVSRSQTMTLGCMQAEV
jgi:hypothetical protein